MQRDRIVTLGFAAVIAFASGAMGSALAAHTASDASAAAPKVLTAEEFRLVDSTGRITARLTRSGEGTPVLWLFDGKGVARLQAGLYENGQPLFGLFDEGGQAVGLFRVAGSKGSPVLVMKAHGQDRMILGLGMDSPEQDPFLTAVDAKGGRRDALARP